MTLLPPRPEDWVLIDIGESDATVYRRGDVFAKCCDPSGIAELAAERDRAQWLADRAFPGASVVDWLESPSDGACLLTAAVPGVPGDALPPAAHQRAMQSLGTAFRELHSLTDCPFERPLAKVIETAADVVRRDAVNPAFLTDEWRLIPPSELLTQVVAESPYVESVLEPVVCHGDACLPNIFFDPGTLEVTGLIDLGRLGVADRYLDLALLVAQLHSDWSTGPAPFLEAYGIPEPDSRRLQFFHLLDPLTWG